MVYFEAIANSIDANADLIDIFIKINAYNQPDTLSIEIVDNGEGFNEENFYKFSNLLETEENDHKGIGRLVFLNYFKQIEVESIYENKLRKFQFTSSFKGKSEITEIENSNKKTSLKFIGYTGQKVKQYDYLRPTAIRKSILLKFYPLLYSLKIRNKNLSIKIHLETKEPNPEKNFYNENKELNINSLPDFKVEKIPATGLDLFKDLELHYSIKTNHQDQATITAICADGRTVDMEIISKNSIPQGYEIIFLLISDFFTGKVNPSRETLEISDIELKTVKRLFREKVTEILNDNIPAIQERNKKTNEILTNQYPHLQGYFEKKSVGLIDKEKSLEIAQKKFFNAQKEILEATNLTDNQYEQSLEVSSRLLTEYILYRSKIINKLKQIDIKNKEQDIHNIIVPMRKSFQKSQFMNDLYQNNAWLLDDKYMSYSVILSDLEMDKLLQKITEEESLTEKDENRPDIAIVFSNDPLKTEKVDVVIVELKKLGLPLERKNDIVVQLVRRATKLLEYYQNKIQRIWFYGIIDLDKPFIRLLKGFGFAELYSNDTVLYKPQDIYMEDDFKIPIGIYIQSFDAFLKDAESRNSTFLNILKEGLKQNND